MNGQPSFWRIAKRQFWLALGFLLFLLGAGLLAAGGLTLWKERRFASEGTRAEGVVVQKYTRRGSKGSTRYHVAYQFRTETGRVVDGNQRVSGRTWSTVPEQGRVRVEYLPTDPHTNRLTGESKEAEGQVLSGLGAGLGAIGGLVFFRSLRRVRTILRLLEGGGRAEGTVEQVEETSLRINRARQWRVHYSYKDYAGRPFTGKSEYLSPREAAEWKAGDKGAVRFDQERPEVSVWVGREGFP